MATAEVCRKHGVSSAIFYKWKAKFGGLDVADARRLRALEAENTKLKRPLAEAMIVPPNYRAILSCLTCVGIDWDSRQVKR